MASDNQLPFQKQNYLLIVIGVVVVLIGFLLMIGGAPEDPSVFNPEVFSFRRITLAPIVLMLGYATVAYGIMKKPKE